MQVSLMRRFHGFIGCESGFTRCRPYRSTPRRESKIIRQYKGYHHAKGTRRALDFVVR
jgi:hypothetical protein